MLPAQVAKLEVEIQQLGKDQKKWEKDTQDEFEEIRTEQERVVAELTKKAATT